MVAEFRQVFAVFAVEAALMKLLAKTINRQRIRLLTVGSVARRTA